MNAEYSPESETLSASVATDKCLIDTDELVQLAGIPSWDPTEFQARGTASVNGSVKVNSEKKVAYHAEVQLESGRRGVPKNGMTIDQIDGEWVVDNGLITFPRVTASIIGADITLDGRLNINPGSEGGRVNVKLDGLAVDQLPIDLEAINDVQGLLAGSAQFELSAPEGQWHIEGTGQGGLNGGAWRDIPIAQLTCQFSLPPWMLAQPFERPKAGRLQVDFRIADHDVPRLLRAVAPEAEFREQDLGGKLALNGQVTVPLQSVDRVDTYSADATLSVNGLQLADLHVPQLVARAQLANGRLEMPEITVQLQPAGRLTANGSVELETDGLAQLSVELIEVPIGVTEPFAPDSLPDVVGTVNGNLQADVPWTSWNDASRWHGTATVTSTELNIDKVKLERLATQVELKNQQLAFTDMKLAWEGAELNADATLRLDEPQSFEANYSTDECDLQRLLKTAGLGAVEKAEGKLSVSGRVQGTLSPFQWNAGGHVKFNELKLSDRVATNLEIPWSADPTQLKVNDATAALFGGTIHLTASLPWQSMQDAVVDGRFETLHSDQLNEAFDNLPAQLSGQVSGTFHASQFSSPQSLQADINFRGLKAQTGVVTVSDMSGSLDARDGQGHF